MEDMHIVHTYDDETLNIMFYDNNSIVVSRPPTEDKRYRHKRYEPVCEAFDMGHGRTDYLHGWWLSDSIALDVKSVIMDAVRQFKQQDKSQEQIETAKARQVFQCAMNALVAATAA